MTLKKFLGLATMAALGGLVVACSSTSDSNAGADSGAVVNPGRLPDAASSADAGVCAPADETAFTSKWVPPRAAAAACSTAQLDSFFLCQTQAQNAPAGTLPPSCDPWQKAAGANLTCAQCIDSQDTDAKGGPLISHAKSHTININFAGCFALAEGKIDGSGCGGKIQASSQCTQAACPATICPVATDGTGLDALNTCLGDAGSGTCSTYDTAANDCFGADSGAAAACLGIDGNDFWGNARIVAGVFCGGAVEVTDGGPDTGSTDAGAPDSGQD